MMQRQRPKHCNKYYLYIASILFLLPTISLATSSTTAPITVKQQQEQQQQQKQTEQQQPNIAVQLGTYVRDSFIRLKDGTAQLYTNHQTCNAIRTTQKASLASDGKRGISYGDYDFLEKGKEDRTKLGNVLFLMIFSPNFLPYAFMFFPNMLPSPFANRAREGVNELEVLGRSRAHAVIKAMMDIEREKGRDNTGGVLSKLNPFGRGRAEKSRLRMEKVFDSSVSFLSSAAMKSSPSAVLEMLKDEIYTEEEPSKDRTRLVIVPKPIVKGLSSALDTSPPPMFDIVPHFITRGKVLTHIQKIAAADEFLAKENIDLSSVGGELLREACNSRFIGTAETTEEELRNGLGRWLDLTVRQQEQPKNDADGASVSTDTGGSFYNANLARLALMCYNAVSGVRDTGCVSILPRLLYAAETGN